tara:strand:- start:1224 stop:2207 length:984 start_codon:yes stop_codon:yes gene_type:complete
MDGLTESAECNFGDYFATLDKINVPANASEQETKCCDDTKNYISDEGVIICKKCGSMINNIMDTPEWKFNGTGDSKGKDTTRCGMPMNPLLPSSSVGSTIANTRTFDDKMNRVKKYQSWNAMPYRERSLYKVFMDIEQKCSKNNLSKIISDTAKSLYAIIAETKISRGSNRKGIIAACVYNACKECNVARSHSELADMFDIDVKVMTKGCKNFTEIIRRSSVNKQRYQDTKSVSMDDFIVRFSHNLKLSEKDIQFIQKISRLCEQLKIDNVNTPQSMAAGCIYLYIKHNNLEITKSDISKVSIISEVTINKCYKKLESSPGIIDFLK